MQRIGVLAFSIRLLSAFPCGWGVQSAPTQEPSSLREQAWPPHPPLTHGKLGAGWGRCRALPEHSQQGAPRGLGDKVGRVLSVLSS